MLRRRLGVSGQIPRPLGGRPPPGLMAVLGGGQPPAVRAPRILRYWVDDSSAGDIGTEESVVTGVRGLRAELLTASDLLLVNRKKSAVAATPSDHRAALTTLIQGRFAWEHGGVLVVGEGEVEQELLDVIAQRLGTDVGRVHVGGPEQLYWAEAGKASVLVHLPAVGIPPLTVKVVEAGGGCRAERLAGCVGSS